MHGLNAREGWDSSFERQIDKIKSAIPRYSHTPDPPNTPEGVSEPFVHYLAIGVTDW